MSEMIERVAKALCDEEWGGTQPWDRKPEGFRERYRMRARVAIQAMREPTEAMCAAVLVISHDLVEPGHVYDEYDSDPGSLDENAPQKAWTTMIDASLTD